MLPSIEQRLAQELSAKPAQVAAAIALMDEGATVPFIARYRKSIGVGQYQHDVMQTQLAKSLVAVVEDCVNAVGVWMSTLLQRHC